MSAQTHRPTSPDLVPLLLFSFWFVWGSPCFSATGQTISFFAGVLVPAEPMDSCSWPFLAGAQGMNSLPGVGNEADGSPKFEDAILTS